jgi:hypothetical protein
MVGSNKIHRGGFFGVNEVLVKMLFFPYRWILKGNLKYKFRAIDTQRGWIFFAIHSNSPQQLVRGYRHSIRRITAISEWCQQQTTKHMEKISDRR